MQDYGSTDQGRAKPSEHPSPYPFSLVKSACSIYELKACIREVVLSAEFSFFGGERMMVYSFKLRALMTKGHTIPVIFGLS
jgi:hypothetical protein